MGYYSKMYAYEPFVDQDNVEKIAVFNEVADFLNKGMQDEDAKNLSDYAKSLVNELKKITSERQVSLSEAQYYFSYGLSSEGYVVCDEDNNSENGEECWAKHRAHEILALLLSLVADFAGALRFIGEDGEFWGYFVNPKRRGKPYIMSEMPVYFEENGTVLRVIGGDIKERVYRLDESAH